MASHTVSIIIPCYRQGRYLAEAIDSCLAQTHPAVEIVVVNDGSDDNTNEVARGYGSRITYVSQANAGLPSARNTGIRASRGDYLLFLDSDDRLHAQGVERLLGSASEDHLVVGRFESFSDDPAVRVPDRVGGLPEPWMNDLHDESVLLVMNFACPCAFLSPRKAVLDVGLFDTDPRNYGCEDWDFWIRLVRHGLAVRRIPEVVCQYRLHLSSMTRKNNVRMGRAMVRVLQRNLSLVRSNSVPAAVAQDEKARLIALIRGKLKSEYFDLAYHFRNEGQVVEASRNLLRAVLWGGLGRRELLEFAKIGFTSISRVLPTSRAGGRARDRATQ